MSSLSPWIFGISRRHIDLSCCSPETWKETHTWTSTGGVTWFPSTSTKTSVGFISQSFAHPSGPDITKHVWSNCAPNASSIVSVCFEFAA